MNNDTAKELLSAYRPNGQDATDPCFTEALEQARRDPELRAWFERERHRDQAIAAILSQYPVQGNHKQALLAMVEVAKPVRYHKARWRWFALAACAIFAFAWIGLHFFDSRPIASATVATGLPARLAGWADGISTLDHPSTNVAEIKAWLKSTGAPSPATLPKALAGASPIGCETLHTADGVAVSVICFMDQGQLVHLFVWNADANLTQGYPDHSWFNANGWNGFVWKDGNQVFALLSKASQKDLTGLLT
jgi:hypothetical protein